MTKLWEMAISSEIVQGKNSKKLYFDISSYKRKGPIILQCNNYNFEARLQCCIDCNELL